MRIGGSVMKPYHSPSEWLEQVKELNYSAVIFPVDSSAPKAVVQDFLKCCQDNDLLIGEVGVWRNVMSQTEGEKHIEYAVRQLELAEEVGANCCVNIAGSWGDVWDGYHPAQGTKAFYDAVVETTQRIIDAVKPKKTCFSLEPMPWMAPESPEEYLQLIKDVDREGFKVHLDFANMINGLERYRHSEAFVRKCFELLGPHIRSIHAKDLLIDDHILPVCIREVPPGEGSINLKLALQLARELPGDIPVFVEHLDSHEAYLAASQHMHKLLAAIE